MFVAIIPDSFFVVFVSLQLAEKGKSFVDIQGLTAATMEILLDFVYTETVLVTVENVQELLPAACLLQLKGMCGRGLWLERPVFKQADTVWSQSARFEVCIKGVLSSQNHNGQKSQSFNVPDLVPPCGELVHCNQLNTPHPPGHAGL